MNFQLDPWRRLPQPESLLLYLCGWAGVILWIDAAVIACLWHRLYERVNGYECSGMPVVYTPNCKAHIYETTCATTWTNLDGSGRIDASMLLGYVHRPVHRPERMLPHVTPPVKTLLSQQATGFTRSVCSRRRHTYVSIHHPHPLAAVPRREGEVERGVFRGRRT